MSDETFAKGFPATIPSRSRYLKKELQAESIRLILDGFSPLSESATIHSRISSAVNSDGSNVPSSVPRKSSSIPMSRR